VPQQSGYEKEFGIWCGLKLMRNLGTNNIYTESCVVRKELKGKGGQGYGNMCKTTISFFILMVGLHLILKAKRAHEVSH
jgi:hypothetical protein